MKKFEDFIESGEVRKASKDIAFAESLWKDSKQRVEIIMKVPMDENSAAIIFEQIYESLRECTDAFLAIGGYKSYSHLASILYLEKYKEISQSEIHKLNNAREKRNSSKYYAKKILISDTKDLILFYNEIRKKFDFIFEKILKNNTKK